VPTATSTNFKLTEREREVLSLMAEGHSNEAIGQRLFLSPRTVEAHIRQVFLKLGLRQTPAYHRRVVARGSLDELRPISRPNGRRGSHLVGCSAAMFKRLKASLILGAIIALAATANPASASAASCNGPYVTFDGLTAYARCWGPGASTWSFAGEACGPSYCRNFIGPHYPLDAQWKYYSPRGFIAAIVIGYQ
jgi:hypothetical protein